MAPPMIGTTQKSQSCCRAHPPTINDGDRREARGSALIRGAQDDHQEHEREHALGQDRRLQGVTAGGVCHNGSQHLHGNVCQHIVPGETHGHLVITVRPKAKATPTNPIPNCGNAAARTAAPQPPKTSQNVPGNSALIRFINDICSCAENYHRTHRGDSVNVFFRIWWLPAQSARLF